VSNLSDFNKLPVERETHKVGAETREWVVDTHELPPLSARRIPFLGLSDAAAGFEFATRGWRCGQILVCHGGEGEVRIGDQWQPCGEGQAYLTPAMRPHAYRAAGGRRWQVAWITYTPPHEQTPLAGLDTATLVRVDPRPLFHLISCLYFDQLARRDLAMIESLADAIEQLAYRCTPSQGDAGRLWPVWQAVDADLARPWTVADMGAVISVSDEHLRRLCVRHLGRPPMEQVTVMRMRRAASLLRSSPLKIGAIAELVGYADRFGFASAFKRVYAQSPAAFRQTFGSTKSDSQLVETEDAP
jgi:AraC-like DNA-binding protein